MVIDGSAIVTGLVAFVVNLCVTVFMFGRLHEKADRNTEDVRGLKSETRSHNIRIGNVEQEVSAFNMFMGVQQDRHTEILELFNTMRGEVRTDLAAIRKEQGRQNNGS